MVFAQTLLLIGSKQNKIHIGKEMPMGTDNVIFLEVLEWFDESGREFVHRIPETGSGEINNR